MGETPSKKIRGILPLCLSSLVFERVISVVMEKPKKQKAIDAVTKMDEKLCEIDAQLGSYIIILCL